MMRDDMDTLVFFRLSVGWAESKQPNTLKNRVRNTKNLVCIYILFILDAFSVTLCALAK